MKFRQILIMILLVSIMFNKSHVQDNKTNSQTNSNTPNMKTNPNYIDNDSTSKELLKTKSAENFKEELTKEQEKENIRLQELGLNLNDELTIKTLNYLKATIRLYDTNNNENFRKFDKDKLDTMFQKRMLSGFMSLVPTEQYDKIIKYVKTLVKFKNSQKVDSLMTVMPYYLVMRPTVTMRNGMIWGTNKVTTLTILCDLSSYKSKDLAELSYLLMLKRNGGNIFNYIKLVGIFGYFAVILQFLYRENITAIYNRYKNFEYNIKWYSYLTLGFYQLVNSYYTNEIVLKFYVTMCLFNLESIIEKVTAYVFFIVVYSLSYTLSLVMVGSETMTHISKSMGTYFLTYGIIFMVNKFDTEDEKTNLVRKSIYKLYNSCEFGSNDVEFNDLKTIDRNVAFLRWWRWVYLIFVYCSDAFLYITYFQRIRYLNGSYLLTYNGTYLNGRVNQYIYLDPKLEIAVRKFHIEYKDRIDPVILAESKLMGQFQVIESQMDQVNDDIDDTVNTDENSKKLNDFKKFVKNVATPASFKEIKDNKSETYVKQTSISQSDIEKNVNLFELSFNKRILELLKKSTIKINELQNKIESYNNKRNVNSSEMNSEELTSIV